MAPERRQLRRPPRGCVAGGTHAGGRHPRPKIADQLDRRPDELRRVATARKFAASPAVFNGYVPAERHEHFDAAGKLTGWTIVTRETEWPADAQERALALTELEDRAELNRAQLCACGCGQPAVDTQREPGEPGVPYSVGHKICTARQALDAYKRFVFDTLDPPKGQTRPSAPQIKPVDGLVFTLAAVPQTPNPDPEEG